MRLNFIASRFPPLVHARNLENSKRLSIEAALARGKNGAGKLAAMGRNADQADFSCFKAGRMPLVFRGDHECTVHLTVFSVGMFNSLGQIT